jgi:hypothetical protein
MSIPAFVEFTDAETAFNAGVGQDYRRKMKDDFTNLNARAQILESHAIFFDHFTERHEPTGALSDPSLPLLSEDGVFKVRPHRWRMRLFGGSGDAEDRTLNKPAYSVAGIQHEGSGTGTFLWTVPDVRFDLVTLPITFEARVKLDQSDREPIVGLKEWQTTNPATTDAPGIWLDYIDTSNWRFVSYDTARNNGGSFAKVSAGSWFTVKIVFTDDPSNRALCYVDGVLKETLTTQLPTAKRLNAVWGYYSGANAGSMHIDRLKLDVLGHADAA